MHCKINISKVMLACLLIFALTFVNIVTVDSTLAKAKQKPLPAPGRLLVKKAFKSSLLLYWNRVPKAKGYVIYKKKGGKYKKVKTLRSPVWIDIKAGYRKTSVYKVRAYKVTKGKRIYGKYSPWVSARTYGKNDKRGNATRVRIYPGSGFSKTELGIGMTQDKREYIFHEISAKRKGKKRKPISKKIRWYSTNPAIATIDPKTTLITAKRKTGTCYVYAMAHNGLRSNYYKVVVKDYAYEPFEATVFPGALQIFFRGQENDIRDICSYYSKHPAKQEWKMRHNGDEIKETGSVPNDKMISRVRQLLEESPYVTSIRVGMGSVKITVTCFPMEYTLRFLFDWDDEQEIKFHETVAPHWIYEEIAYV